MAIKMHAAPLFDPAVFFEAQPSCRPAHSDTPYSSSSSSSLAWTASSSRSSLSSAGSSADEDEDGERNHCLDLLNQLQSEVARFNGQHTSADPGSSVGGARYGVREPCSREADPSAESAIFHASPTRWRSINYASPEQSASHDRTRTPSPGSTRIHRSPRIQRRKSGRPSPSTRDDIADLDIDAILAAYERDGVLPSLESGGREEGQSWLRTATSSSTIRPQYHTPPRPSSPTPSTSSASALSILDEQYPHRRVAPFPTIPRAKSSASLRSVARSQRERTPSDVPPVPTLPFASHPTVPPQRRRIFTSFPTPAPAPSSSTSSSSPAPVSTVPRPPSSTAMRPTSSRDSRYSTRSTATSFSSSSASSAASSRRDSHRWSIASASTAASSVSLGCTSEEQHGVGRQIRFDSVDEADEYVESQKQTERRRQQPQVLHHTLPFPAAENGRNSKRDSCGLISWQDFAHELDEVTPPSFPPSFATFPPSAAAVAPSRPAQQATQHNSVANPAMRDGVRTGPSTTRTTTRLGRGLVRHGLATFTP
ncbi:hypothetical protein C6P46_000254 [Rhodotorula mucilaginosa]|uniref:Uncharacterized protein n=1 Tax=Rhodotorula mucilaginosa TaxID=5537 RepID=A0A9P6W6G0_RHOMI|nr:hypothetical protein C6P46_000254 [Rhodotorula mucilaginosa]